MNLVRLEWTYVDLMPIGSSRKRMSWEIKIAKQEKNTKQITIAKQLN